MFGWFSSCENIEYFSVKMEIIPHKMKKFDVDENLLPNMVIAWVFWRAIFQKKIQNLKIIWRIDFPQKYFQKSTADTLYWRGAYASDRSVFVVLGYKVQTKKKWFSKFFCFLWSRQPWTYFLSEVSLVRSWLWL